MIGCYRGIRYVRHRHCDMFPCADRPIKSLYWFPYDLPNGGVSGNHFRTKAEMFAYIDSEIRVKFSEQSLEKDEDGKQDENDPALIGD